MQLKVIGLNHRTAPLDIREKVTIPEDSLRDANNLYHQAVKSKETMILSTCNRIETYFFEQEGNWDEEITLRFLCDFGKADIPDLSRYTYTLRGKEAVSHLLRVASGLDSMVVGEAQITGQLKSAHRIAREEGTAKKELNRLMSYTLFTAKKVRTETSLSELSVSVSSVAVELARKIFEDLSSRNVLLVGAGKMSRLAARGFVSAGVEGLSVVNRTLETALLFSDELGGRAFGYESLQKCLVSSDIVIVSTGAREHILTRPMMEKIIRERKNQPLFIIDITVPRNVEPAVNSIDGIFLYDIDSLVSVINEHMESRHEEAGRAEEIIRDHLEGFLEYTRQMSLGPVVRALRHKVEEILLEELEAQRDKIPPEEYERMKELMFRTVNRLSHPLIQEIKSSAEDFPELLQNQEHPEGLVREAFRLREKE